MQLSCQDNYLWKHLDQIKSWSDNENAGNVIVPFGNSMRNKIEKSVTNNNSTAKFNVGQLKGWLLDGRQTTNSRFWRPARAVKQMLFQAFYIK